MTPSRTILGACVGAILMSAAVADEAPWLNERVEVTATRVPEPVDNVPASISIVTGDELRARGATDLPHGARPVRRRRGVIGR